jgi:urease accessory protein UreH
MTEPTGEVSANFAIARGQTVITRKYHSSPLKIAKTFPLSHGQAAVYVMDSSPGMMAGDEYKLDLTLGENTKVYITNQSGVGSAAQGASRTTHAAYQKIISVKRTIRQYYDNRC